MARHLRLVGCPRIAARRGRARESRRPSTAASAATPCATIASCYEIDLKTVPSAPALSYLRRGLPRHGGGAAAARRHDCSAPTTCSCPNVQDVPEEVALLFRSIGEHLGMALENARLKRENLRIALMNERQMMATEVHDSLAQTLAYMKMRMALLQDALTDGEDERAGKYALDVEQALDDAYRAAARTAVAVSQPHGSARPAACPGKPGRRLPRPHRHHHRVLTITSPTCACRWIRRSRCSSSSRRRWPTSRATPARARSR